MKKLLPLVLLACGGEAHTDPTIGELQHDDRLGTIHQPLTSDNNFGVVSGSLAQCNPGVTGTCYYPPGFDDGSGALDPDVSFQWRVCLDQKDWGSFTGTGTAYHRAWIALQRVQTKASLEFLQSGADIVISGNCDDGGSYNIRFDKGATGGSPGTPQGQGIRAYVDASCVSQSQTLAEVPSISGTHRYCYNWFATLDTNDIDLGFQVSQRVDVTEHALGHVLGAAAVGTGAHGQTAFDRTYQFASVLPLPKTDGVIWQDVCRAATSYDNPAYFSISKADNSCD